MYDFKKVEEEVSVYWEKERIYQKAKEKNHKGKKFYFLDGPPYTSGKVHLGTAWNKSLKDCVLRYRRMAGFNVWDRAGYDMHGLPTAHKVEEKFGIKSKDQIKDFGEERYIRECIKLSTDNMLLMNADFKKLGVWMDFENAYQSIKPEFIERVWWLIKKAHENKRLYESKLAMTWCKHCATALAKHELEYENVRDNSIFVKFPLVGADKEFLIIWTTTPWTIPFNLGVMANPELEYVKAKVGDESWILAKVLANAFIRGVVGKDFKIIEELKGSELEGLKYRHPLYDDLKSVYDEISEKSAKAFSVVLSEEYVDTSAGSGLVHMAPGCGPEDYEIGHKNHIPAFNNLDEFGRFPKTMGRFAGLVAKDDDKKIVEVLKEKGAVIAETPVEHEYAHCWRCKQPIIYRTTKQWFFKVEDIKENMRELNKEIYWVPDYAGNRQFDSWLANLKDNCLTRQRSWGTPFPVWRCENCGDYIVIGSAEELKKLGGKIPEDLHMPWIDTVTFPCKCGGIKKRIPDIIDVWVDAGSASWNCLDHPPNEQLFNQLFPPDFILEGIDQVRGWFNMLFVASMVAMQKPCFKAVYMHGFINDALGRKMSKSLGNYITPDEVLPKYGVDSLRYYMIGGTNPGLDLNYNFDDLKIRFKNLGVLWNLHELLLSSAKAAGINPAHLNPKKFDLEERFILSKLNSTIESVTELYEKYYLSSIPPKVEELYLTLSRDYIRLVRDKLNLGDAAEKEKVLYTLYKVIIETLKIFAPICPFITEAIYLDFRKEFSLKEESIHLSGWPAADKKLIDTALEKDFTIIDTLTQKILYARDKMGMGVRWPLKEIIISTKDKDVRSAVDNLSDLIKLQTNIKSIVLKESFEAKLNVKADYEKIRKEFTALSPQVIAHIAITSPNSILKHIEKEGEYKFMVDHASLSLKKEHLVVEKEAPEGFVYVDFPNGELFINKSLTPELEAEGFARELVRRVQEQRKAAKLNKQDKIELYIVADPEMKKQLEKHESDIKERVGAQKQQLSETPTQKTYHFAAEVEIKGRKFKICFDKLPD